jgi:MarR-like DNA-binding transcriptional regulator SgrR of sgrS sRNA
MKWRTYIYTYGLIALSITMAYAVIFPEYGGKITVFNSYLPSGIDPLWHISSEELELDGLLYDTLCSVERDGNVSLMLLKSAFMEGNVWHFELRPDLYFSSHKAALSSYDVKNTILKLKNTLFAYHRFYENITMVTELDALNFSIELKQPDPLFLQKLCHPSSAIARRWNNAQNEEEIMGSGPFRIKENHLPESLTLEANESYYKGKPFVQEITFISSSKVNPIFYFKSGSFQLLSLWGSRIAGIDELISSSNLIESKPPVLMFLLINPTLFPTSEITFRNWIGSKVNRAEMLQSLFNNRGQAITSLFSNTGVEKNKRYTRVNYTGEILVIALKRDVLSSLVAERIQAILISEGFKTKIEYHDDKNYFKAQQSEKFHILVGEIAPYYHIAELNMLEFRSIYSCVADYSSREVQSAPQEYENQLLQDSILVPLVSLRREYAASDKIHFYLSTFNGLYDLQNVWLF